MPSWFTVVKNLPPDDGGRAAEFIEALACFAETADIPKSAAWRAFRRGIGVVVTAEWEYGAPGAVPATEVDLAAGVPILIEVDEVPEVPKGE